MKTITRYKSLLLAGGLLLICLTGRQLSQPRRSYIFIAVKAGSVMATTKRDIDSGGGSYIKEIAGKLFPVLKSLNIM